MFFNGNFRRPVRQFRVLLLILLACSCLSFVAQSLSFSFSFLPAVSASSAYEFEDDEDAYDHDEFYGEPAPPKGNKKNETAKKDDKNNYYLEFAGIIFVVAYAANFIFGMRKNQKVKQEWFAALESTLQSQFHDISAFEGDAELDGSMWKESQNCYKLYASGRTHCSGMLITLKLKCRQDLFSVILAFLDLAQSRDKVLIEINMNDECVDTFVFSVMKKREESRYRDIYPDLKDYAQSVSSPRLPKSLSVLTDCADLQAIFLDGKVLRTIEQQKDLFLLMHLTDQNRNGFGGSHMLRFEYFFPKKGDFSGLLRLTEMAVYFVDCVAKVTISPQARKNAVKWRQRVISARSRASHSDRQEAYARKKRGRARASVCIRTIAECRCEAEEGGEGISTGTEKAEENADNSMMKIFKKE
eukprot:679829_1